MAYTFQNMDVPGAVGGTRVDGINDLGQITGSYTAGESPTLPYDPYPQAFIQSPGGGLVSLGGSPYGQHSYGYDINNSGQIVGQSGHYEETGRGFVRNTDGSFTRIDYTGDGAFTYAYGTNDYGAVVGQAISFDITKSPLSQPVGFLWQNGSITETFQVPGGSATSANDINNDGRVVGTYTVGSTQHGFVAQNSTAMWGLDVPGAVSTDVQGINDSNVVAGSYFDGSRWHGFIDDANGQMQFIDAPGAVDTHLTGINNLGDVSGYSDAGNPSQPSGFVAHDPVTTMVRELYQGGLGRDADSGGVTFWTNELKTGALTPRDFVFSITGSSEGRALYGQQTNGQYVDSVYANALGRQADPGGHAAWTNLLQAGCARADVMAAITQSSEGQQHFMLTHA